jgi:Tfp pilus assembly protein PilO
MNFMGREMTTRETVLVAVTGATVLGLTVFWVPQKLSAGSESPSAIKESLEIAKSKLQKSIKEVTGQREDLGVEKVVLPDTEDANLVYLHVQNTAKDTGLGFSSLTATQPKKGKGFQTINYRFTATSNLKSLVKFVDQIQSGGYLICLEKWSMKPMEDPQNVQTEISLRAYFAPEKKGKTG